MKRLLFPLALLLMSFTAQAQWSAGIRSGAGFWNVSTLNEETYQHEVVKTTLWQNLVYARFEVNDMLALEAGLSHFSVESPGEVYGLCGVGLPVEYEFVSGLNYRERIYSLELRGMLRVLRFGRFSNELGLMLAPGVSRLETIQEVNHVTPGGNDQFERSTVDSRICMQFGIEDQIHYRVGRRVDAVLSGGIRYIDGARFVNNGSYAQVGLGYRF